MDAYVSPEVIFVDPKPAHPSLALLGEYLKTVEQDSLGDIEFSIEPVTPYWDRRENSPLTAVGQMFMKESDDSLIVVLSLEGHQPVVYLGSEGGVYTLGNSVPDFLWCWARGEVDLFKLSEKNPSALAALQPWLRANGIVEPEPAEVAFDCQAWLDGGTGFEVGPPDTSPIRKHTDHMSKLDADAQEIANLVGRRLDDWVATEWISQHLPPRTRIGYQASVEKLGVVITVGSNLTNLAYPILRKTENSVINYIQRIDLSANWCKPIAGLQWTATLADMEAVLGPPNSLRSVFWDEPALLPLWKWTLDEGAQTQLLMWHDEGLKVLFEVIEGRVVAGELSPMVGVFISWAIEKHLIARPSKLDAAEMYDRVAARQATGSDFFRLLPRGLLAEHFGIQAGLYVYLSKWFNNLSDFWITKDFRELFGEREGEYGHMEPVLDDDNWDKVDRAASLLAKRLGPWLSSTA